MYLFHDVMNITFSLKIVSFEMMYSYCICCVSLTNVTFLHLNQSNAHVLNLILNVKSRYIIHRQAPGENDLSTVRCNYVPTPTAKIRERQNKPSIGYYPELFRALYFLKSRTKCVTLMRLTAKFLPYNCPKISLQFYSYLSRVTCHRGLPAGNNEKQIYLTLPKMVRFQKIFQASKTYLPPLLFTPKCIRNK